MEINIKKEYFKYIENYYDIDFTKIEFNKRYEVEGKLWELWLVVESLKKQELKVNELTISQKLDLLSGLGDFLLKNKLIMWFLDKVDKIKAMI